MYRTCIKLLYVFVFLPVLCFGQFSDLKHERGFLQHLQQQKLYRERMFVLHNLLDTSDTLEILLEKAWTYHALRFYDSALALYRQVPYDTLLQYKFNNNYLNLLFKQACLEELGKITHRYPLQDGQNAEKVRLSLDLIYLRYPITEIKDSGLPTSVSEQYERYHKIKRKSGVLAATYSIVLPGSGKLYYDHKRQAWNMFLANAALGVQTYESYRKSGVSSGRFIIFGSLFSVFYISNIYGTIAGLKKAKRDHFRQLHYEITNSFFMDSDVHPAQQ